MIKSSNSICTMIRFRPIIRKTTLVLWLAAALFIISGCNRDMPAKNVSIEKQEKLVPQVHEGVPIKIAIGSMITPKVGFAYYKKLLNYIEDRLGRPVILVDRSSYDEINALLKSAEIDAAFVCGRPYVDGHEEFGLELLAQPVVYGNTVYYSYIIVNADSDIESFQQLRGKSFAFADPKSNSGKLAPTYILAKDGETPETFFSKYSYTYAHDKSIEAVALGIVDGAAVDSLIWEYLNAVNPEHTGRTKVIHRSEPYGIPPFVVNPALDKETKLRLKEILLQMHDDPQGSDILKGMKVDKFAEGSDSDYDSIRHMIALVEGTGERQ